MNSEAKTLLGLGLATLAILVVGAFFVSKSSKEKLTIQEPEIVLDTKVLEGNGDHKIASDSAKLTVVEFADFQCPACGNVHPIVKQIIKKYEGKINYIYRHFPLPAHKNAEKAALASEAASEQSKFWEYSDILFERQDDWSLEKDPTQKFISYAQELKLDINKFEKSIKEEQYKDKIKADKNDGFTLKINSTPTFFIAGKKINGGMSAAMFEREIEDALKATN